MERSSIIFFTCTACIFLIEKRGRKRQILIVQPEGGQKLLPETYLQGVIFISQERDLNGHFFSNGHFWATTSLVLP